MGDRYNVAFKASERSMPIWLYSHWGGADRFTTIAEAVEAARPRWYDPSYATRVATSSIIGKWWTETTGFGLEAADKPSTMGDYPEALVVIWDAELVQVVDERTPDVVRYTMTFKTFLDERSREKALGWVGADA